MPKKIIVKDALDVYGNKCDKELKDYLLTVGHFVETNQIENMQVKLDALAKIIGCLLYTMENPDLEYILRKKVEVTEE